MTTPSDTFTPPVAGSCDAFQWEISQALDECRSIPESTRVHLRTCPHCIAFAEAWAGEGALVSLLAPAPTLDLATAQRLVQSALTADAPASSPVPVRRASSGWLMRAAALLAVGALGWWLLDPKTVPPKSSVAENSGGPALAVNRQMARLEEPLAQERLALQDAAGDGLHRLREVLYWSSGVLQ